MKSTANNEDNGLKVMPVQFLIFGNDNIARKGLPAHCLDLGKRFSLGGEMALGNIVTHSGA